MSNNSFGKQAKNSHSEIVEKLYKEIEDAKSELMILKMSTNKKDRERYERKKESLLEKVSSIESAEQKGIELGIEKGIELGKKNMEILVAKNAIDIGLDDNLIHRVTGLSLEEIKELREQECL